MEEEVIWGWQIGLYLFLGGMSAGAAAFAGLIHLGKGKDDVKTLCVTYWLAAAGLAVGALLLLADITNPLRGLLLWQSFSNFGSWMTVGVYLLILAIADFGLLALVFTYRWKKAPSAKDPERQIPFAKASKALAGVGIALGCGVAAYTGILLMSAPGIPFWDTALLPLLFFVSGIDTGVAEIELVSWFTSRREAHEGQNRETHRFLSRSVCVLVVAELVVLIAYLGTMCAAGSGEGAMGEAMGRSAQALLFGELAVWFWILVVVIGLALPLVVALLGLRKERAADRPEDGAKHSALLTCVGACGALLGGCALRFLILSAGSHADLAASTLSKLFM